MRTHERRISAIEAKAAAATRPALGVIVGRELEDGRIEQDGTGIIFTREELKKYAVTLILDDI